MFTACFLLAILFAEEAARFHLAFSHTVTSSSTLEAEGRPIRSIALVLPMSKTEKPQPVSR